MGQPERRAGSAPSRASANEDRDPEDALDVLLNSFGDVGEEIPFALCRACQGNVGTKKMLVTRVQPYKIADLSIARETGQLLPIARSHASSRKTG